MNDRQRPTRDLRRRLDVFLRAGLLERLPTWDQIRQGELEMLPYVASAGITNMQAYRSGALGHPLVRQPLVFSQVGRDHWRAGLGLEVSLNSLVTHLHLTYHQGMPKYDLQLLQTHDGGLDALQNATERLLAQDGKPARRTARLAGLLLRQPKDYHKRFLGADGWIERARRFDYPDEECGIPAEFSCVTSFLNYCTQRFPPVRPQLSLHRVRADVHLLSRMFREGGRLGWFARGR